MKETIGFLLFMTLIASCNADDYTHNTEDIAGIFYDGGMLWGHVTITITGDSFHADYKPGSAFNPGTIDGKIKKCRSPDNNERIGWCVNKAEWKDTASVNDNQMRSGTVTFWISDSDIKSMTGDTWDENGKPRGSVTLTR